MFNFMHKTSSVFILILVIAGVGGILYFCNKKDNKEVKAPTNNTPAPTTEEDTLPADEETAGEDE